MYPLIKRILFLLSPERAHHVAMSALSALAALPAGKALLRSVFGYTHPSLPRDAFGLRFPNPVGLAAGFDKDARYTDVLECLGFGFVEIGTVTPRPQPGNARPRLFRLPADRALINRMGFNNQGAAAAAARLRRRKGSVIIGGNIGKNKDTPLAEAFADYAEAFRALRDVVDYFAVNVSSPNTPGLRGLQEKEPLKDLLHRLQELNRQSPHPRPMLLKIAPDLNESQLDDILAIAREAGLAGIIATNTTIGRDGLRTPARLVEAMGPGGLSGRPLAERSTAVVRYLHRRSGGTMPIIAAGGISGPADVQEKLAAGACLVQLYTGFIYEGPSLMKRISRSLAGAPPAGGPVPHL